MRVALVCDWFLKHTASLAAEHSLRVYREAVAARRLSR